LRLSDLLVLSRKRLGYCQIFWHPPNKLGSSSVGLLEIKKISVSTRQYLSITSDQLSFVSHFSYPIGAALALTNYQQAQSS
jgi:hypothetical protein